jgi:hypothetical protein
MTLLVNENQQKEFRILRMAEENSQLRKQNEQLLRDK